MDKKIPPLTKDQRKACLLLRKLHLSGDLQEVEWLFLKNSSPIAQDMPLEEFIATMKAELPAWRYHLRHEFQSKITKEEVDLWCLANDLPID
jgi:hypothetical protein